MSREGRSPVSRPARPSRLQRIGRFITNVYATVGLADTAVGVPALWATAVTVLWGALTALAAFWGLLSSWHPSLTVLVPFAVLIGFPWALVGSLRAYGAIFRPQASSPLLVAAEPEEPLEEEQPHDPPAPGETLEHLRTIGHSLMEANNLLRGLSQQWIAAGDRSSDSIEARRVESLERFAAHLVQVHVRDAQAATFQDLERALESIKGGGTQAEAGSAKQAIAAALTEYQRLASALVDTMETFTGKDILFEDRHYLGLRSLNEDLHRILLSVRFRQDVGSLSHWARVIAGVFPESLRRPG